MQTALLIVLVAVDIFFRFVSFKKIMLTLAEITAKLQAANTVAVDIIAKLPGFHATVEDTTALNAAADELIGNLNTIQATVTPA